MEIKNCAAIISGAASGMGAATAKMLASAGAHVVLLDMNQEAVEKIAKEIQGTAIHCDVTNAEQVAHAIEQVKKLFGSLQICINCAGIVQSKRMVGKQGAMPLEEFRRVIEVNLIGTYNLMRLAAEAMIVSTPIGPSQERGVIINTASIAAFEGQIGQTAYSASKGGIASLTLPVETRESKR